MEKIIFLLFLTTRFYYSYGCSFEGFISPLPVSGRILDTFRGVIFDRATANIEGITGITYGEGIKYGSYVDIYLDENSRFVMTTNEAFEDYEEHETTDIMSITVDFRCTDSTTSITFRITVVDTNNNAPRFLPSGEFTYAIAAPVPPGFEITGCLDDLTVRDIDLTTQRIDFGIEDNPYFEIEYDADSSTTVKEFKATLRTKEFIRSIPEPITLTISATDVDLTGDDPRTTYATVTFIGNTDFELPEEPVFSQTYYLADYTEDNSVVLSEQITLSSGYHDLVQFSIEGEYSTYFTLIPNPDDKNLLSIGVVTPLEDDVLTKDNILLVVRANREQTSGASATIILQLPQGVPLEFESAHYEGTIENDILDVPRMVLSQGYEGAHVSAIVLNEHSSFFAANVEGNIVTLSMTSLHESIINENSFIYLQIVASTDRSTTSTIVTLEIIKDDNVTPVFNWSIYSGSYNPETGLSLQQIVLVQGYDGIDSMTLTGDYANYFQVSRNGAIVSIAASTIPPEIYSMGRIVLSLEATKPRTVGANAAIIITLPAARELEFEASSYRGSLQGNEVTLDPILLPVGYHENVIFTITGDYVAYFEVLDDQSGVIINLVTPIPSDIILENNVIILTLTASGLNTVTTSTSVLLDIIKDDTTTPVFSRNIYYGTYLGTSNINIDDIYLAQGFDDGVTFELDGDHAQYFEITNVVNRVILTLKSTIPEDVIFAEKVLQFNVLAEKALTVGANAVVSIRFPSELTDPVIMSFTQSTYTATIDNNVFTEKNIVLSSGYAPRTNFELTGEYSTYFSLTPNNNVVSLSLLNPLPSDAMENTFIILEIEASRERAVPVSTSVVIDIIKKEIVAPIFTQAYYRGVYSTDSGLQFDEVISLLFGYDETVNFQLVGEFASLFDYVENDSNSLSIIAKAPIMDEILEDNSHLLFSVVASKQGAASAHATISIDIEKENTQGPSLGFDRVTYLGSIQDNVAYVGPITIIEGYTDEVTIGLYGEFANYFTTSGQANVVSVVMLTPIPATIIPENRIIVLEIRASSPQANTAFATIVFDVVQQDDTSPTVQLAFDAPYYTGSYNAIDGLVLETPIALTDGHDDSVLFDLQGEHSQWFSVVRSTNSITLMVSSAIPSAVLTANHQLVFVISAQRPGASAAQATIVISLTDDENTQGPSLGFDRVTYLGSIQDNVAYVGPITIIEGYTDEVTIGLYGEFANYFTTSGQANVVSVVMLTPIPATIIPENRIIVLEIRASSPQANTAFATIVFDVVQQDDTSPTVQLAFDAPYYTGSYNAIDGLVLETPIALTDGHDDSVLFDLQGEHSQWFSVVRSTNSITLMVSSAIPSAVLTANHQLVFVISAQRPGASAAQATIVISLTDDENTQGPSLGFDRVTYLGSIQDNVAYVGPITIIEGYTDEVTIGLYGEFANYFTTSGQANVVSVVMLTPIPATIIPENRIIVLEIRASSPQANTAFATIVFDVVQQDDTSPTVQLAFDAPYYTGSYNAIDGLVLETPIALTDGHDDSVLFDLQGEHSQWFSVVRSTNSITLMVSSAIPSAVLTANHQLVFVISAQRPGASAAQATIVISLTDDENTQGPSLGFDRVTYLGSIQDNVAYVGPITIIEGYTDEVTIGLYGEFANYFTTSRQANVVSVVMLTPIPATIIPENRIIVLEIRASSPQANTAFATIVFDVVQQDDTSPTVQLAFDAPYYTGSYNAIDGLVLETPIALTDGHDDSVLFDLQGEHSQWFSVVRSTNSITLMVSSAIPSAVLTANHQLVFVISAQRPGASAAQATIVISLTDDENTQGPSLGFDRVTYLGSIQDNVAYVGPITIIEGYTDEVTIGLYGEFANYFTTSRQANVVSVVMLTPIPATIIPENRIIVLEIRASSPQANTAFATIVFDVVQQDDTSPTVQLAFDAPYYTGSYNAIDGLVLETPIALTDGHDDSVLFDLQGEHSQWFSVVRSTNSITLMVSSAIPSAVLTANHQLVFVISAQRPGASAAQATIVISLTDDENTQGPSLGFDRVTYLGSIQDNVAYVGPITIIEGYTDEVTIGLYGEFANYFTTSRQANVVSVVMLTPIPATIIPENRIIVLEIRASSPQANTAFATIVFDVVQQDDTSPTVQLAFDAPYYTGSYNAIDGLVLETPIALTDGHDDSVLFDLQGEHSQWFSVVRSTNSITLMVSSAIPSAVLTANHQLVFVISAQRPGASAAQATIVISLTDDENTQGPSLGFDRVTYLGSIQDNVAYVGPITIIEGYTDEVTIGLYGEFANYFTTSRQANVVSVVMLTPIPATIIPENRIIVLEIRASSPQANTAFATIVFDVVQQDDTSPTVQLAFDAPYYTGSYNAIDGLVLETPIALTDGHDDSVLFDLQGEHSQWFSVVRSTNSITLMVSSAIPSAVLTANHQLVFVISAQRPGASAAQATIVISLTDDENTQGPSLGFDRVTYLGSIQDNVAYVGPITIIEGYTDEVTIGLYGEFANYFTTSRQANVVSVVMLTPIPATIIPENRIIVLEIRASSPQANTAFATIVFDVVQQDDTSPTVQLAFDAPYYTGSYNAIDGLVLETPIALTDGHDDSVLFDLQGEHSQWFSVVRSTNSITLMVSSAIPSAVLTANHQLVFVISAQRPGASAAQATIVISLTDDENTQGPSLGFDRVTYLGSIQDNVAYVGPITIIEGYTDEVTIGLYGEFANYFTTSRQANVVSVVMLTPIPVTIIPENRIIVLEIRASSPQANTAFATIVFDVVQQDDTSPTVQLAFDAPYYTGSYNAIDGLVLETPIALTDGHDDSVLFDLQGEHSQWFSVVRSTNSITLMVSSAIPSAVLTANHQLVFVISAQRPGASAAQATIVISLTDDENTQGPSLGFDRVTYLGSIQDNVAYVGPITIIEGYTDEVTIGLYGEFANYFTTSRQANVVSVVMLTPIPVTIIPENRIIVLEIRASSPQANTAFATIVFDVVQQDDTSPTVQLAFDAPYYTGSYNAIDGLVLETPIALTDGHDDSVLFDLQGEHSQWFSVVRSTNSITLMVSSAIPSAVLTANHQLVFVISAQRPGASAAQATIVISLTDDENTQGPSLGFDRVTYLGSIQDNVAYVGPITIIEGYTDEVTIGLYGEFANYFTTSRQANVVSVVMLTPIPATIIPENRIIVLEIRASSPQANTAFATIVFDVVQQDDTSPTVQLAFDAPYYTGSYNAIDGLVLETPIALTDGHDDSVLFDLQGEHSQWFSVVRSTNSITLMVSSAIPSAVLTANHQLVFVISAQRPGASAAQATIVISLTDDENTQGPSLGFDRVTYLGSIQDNVAYVGPITIIEGYTDEVTIGLYGEFANYFTTSRQANVVSVVMLTPIPATIIPENRIIVLEIRASSPQANTAFATIVFDVVQQDDTSPTVQLAFDAPYYTGSYNAIDGLVLETPIALTDGHDDSVLFDLQGEHSQWFSVVRSTNSITLMVSSAIPSAVLTANHQLVFVISAQRPGASAAQATIVISLTDGEDLQTGNDVSFERVFYEGIIQFDEVLHDDIKISGYDGTNVDILGEYSSLFVAYVSDGVVSVQASGSVNLPADVTSVALELHAAVARAVLLLTVAQSDAPVLPSVTFSSETYVLTVGMVQTGLVGRVSATADNGEELTFSLVTNNAHLQTRLSINNEGELYLSAPANSGVYTFQVIATTRITKATGTATVYVTVEAIAVCGDNDIVVPPLIILDRDEEEAHNNLVVLDPLKYNGCHFTLTNRWPTDQTWLYVDNNGLHTTAIDREHESIAFMAVSQVQVELILHCESDNAIRTKRSERTDWLGPYDYGRNKWILTDTIPYNSRRSLVNLIVNDINDNAPIFIGKEHEPIAVGYPTDELEERILPRSLAELKATDADIGENAALVYSSSESVLAVAPTTGFVHVRSGARLEHDQILTVRATDQNGQGLSGTIQLVVKLLSLNHIAVVTIRDAFLDDEMAILAQLSDAVGYEVKTLRSVVISDDIDEDSTRKKRVTETVRASLQLYVYGLNEREPVAVNRLAEDISSHATTIVSVISTIPLEDHLEDMYNLERDIGLLVATIVLSVILFIIILLMAIWFFLRWRKNRNYDEFSDENSLTSRNGSLGELPKPEVVKSRLNIEDLKKSERRLQEMLNAPIPEVTVEPMTSRKKETPMVSILDIPIPEPNAPIVIQSIDKLKDAEDDTDDEFGETNKAPRKSVVTFNENVERIIHVEDDVDADDDGSQSGSGYEIYRL